MGKTLLDKVWEAHKVATLPSGEDQLFIGLHIIHEVTSPQAFAMLREQGLTVKYPERTVATVDHIVPTDDTARPLKDELAEEMLTALEHNTSTHGIRFFSWGSGNQGIVHVIGPELGLTQPGMTIVCGDSHTSTHGALGAIAFGIGTSQIRDVLATQTLAVSKPRIRRITYLGMPGPGIYAKDYILALIARLGVKGGIGYAYEYGGEAIERLGMEGRLTLCNMSIEGGARCGYINPDAVTLDYLRSRPFAPQGKAFEQAQVYWRSMASDPDAWYDDEVTIDVSQLAPMVTWGITPGQGISITERLPDPDSLGDEAELARSAYAHMGLRPGESILGTPIQVAFIGSCTNGRLSDLREAARVVRGRHVAPGVRALVVPGSEQVRAAAEAEGLDQIFTEAGFTWRQAGCSMCLAMNPDRLQGNELCASSSNRNFIGRQGSARGRTMLMSPAMVAAAAICGKITDVREFIS
ncbi:MAG: 3-isopropylmalate dehydratase large subunit [Termitinemataceae bacterium]